MERICCSPSARASRFNVLGPLFSDDNMISDNLVEEQFVRKNENGANLCIRAWCVNEGKCFVSLKTKYATVLTLWTRRIPRTYFHRAHFECACELSPECRGTRTSSWSTRASLPSWCRETPRQSSVSCPTINISCRCVVQRAENERPFRAAA